MRRASVVLAALALSGCSLAFPLSDYDVGTSSSSSATTGGGAAAGGAGGGSGGSGGAGGGMGCEGPFINPPTSDVVETFDVDLGSMSPIGTCASVTAGEAVFAPAPNTPEFCWMFQAAPHRLRCSNLTFRVLETTPPMLGVQTFVYLDDVTTGMGLQLILESGGFQLSLEDGSNMFTFQNEVYSPAIDRWWRFRATADDELVFETSADAMTWTVRTSGPSPVPLDNLRFSIGAGVYQPNIASPGQGRFDCLNATAACP